MNDSLTSRAVIGAAIVGLVGAAGMFIYEQLYAEKRRSMLIREVARLDKQVTSMRSELESLRELQKEAQMRRAKHKKRVHKREVRAAAGDGDIIAAKDVTDAVEQSYTSDSEYFTDYHSVLGTDGEMDSEEFYDVHTDEEDDTLCETLRNGHAAHNPLDEDTKLTPDPTSKVNSIEKNST